jgi:hypothetical protein
MMTGIVLVVYPERRSAGFLVAGASGIEFTATNDAVGRVALEAYRRAVARLEGRTVPVVGPGFRIFSTSDAECIGAVAQEIESEQRDDLRRMVAVYSGDISDDLPSVVY